METTDTVPTIDPPRHYAARIIPERADLYGFVVDQVDPTTGEVYEEHVASRWGFIGEESATKEGDAVAEFLTEKDRERYRRQVLIDGERYLHLHAVDHVKIADSQGERVYVTAEEFMEVQRERDRYRRALAVINARRTQPQWWEPRSLKEFLDRVLSSVDMDYKQGQAVAAIMREFS